MIIQCPHCGFSKDVGKKSIPSTAQLATCPKCKQKFKFRSIEQPAQDDFEWQEETPSAPNQEQHQEEQIQEPVLPRSVPGASTEAVDPVEPADEDRRERIDIPSDFSSERPETGQHPDTPRGGDIWDTLETMHDERPRPRRAPSYEDAPPPPWERQKPDHPEVDVPWERIDEYGFLGGLTQTIKRVMFHPKLFFDAMPKEKGIVNALAFFLLLTFITHVVTFAWMTWLPPETLAAFFQTFGFEVSPEMLSDTHQMNFFQSALINLVVNVIFLVVGTSLVHVSLGLFRGASSGFETTFRACAYATAPQIVYFLFVPGYIIGIPWWIVVGFIALKYVHRTSYVKVLASVLCPIIIMMLVAQVIGSVLH